MSTQHYMTTTECSLTHNEEVQLNSNIYTLVISAQGQQLCMHSRFLIATSKRKGGKVISLQAQCGPEGG